MTMGETAARLEAFLFSEGGSLTRRKLQKLLGTDADALSAAAAELSSHLEGSGLALIATDAELTLAVAPAAAEAVRSAQEKEVGSEIGDAGLEVMAIVLYRGPSTRAEIDYIRGVNTASTLRGLLARGLLERSGNPDDGREYLYRPTPELLAHLGARDGRELPDYVRISEELAAFEATRAAQDAPRDPFHAADE